MKKTIIGVVLVSFLIGFVAVWLVFGPGTAFEEKHRYFIIEDGKTDKASVLEALKENNIISHTTTFGLLASKMHLWKKAKPGKYEVPNGLSLIGLVRKLRNNQQVTVNIVINKIRTKEELARLISKNIEPDSLNVLQFLSSNDSLEQYGVDTNTVFTLIIPNTYNFYWHTSIRKVFNKFAEASNEYWNSDRLDKAKQHGYSPKQMYIIASIVEEETNKDEDKGKIASVYMNRIAKGMALAADPTIKFALKDFTIKRILYGYLNVNSPYNTYRNKGLPPGPICTPSAKTLDLVLDAPKTDYIFFVAQSDFSGYHHFSSTYAEHEKYAKEYQHALDEYQLRKETLGGE